MKINFIKNFDFQPSGKDGLVTIAYKKGMTRDVTRECAKLALTSGCAERVQKPVARVEEVDEEEK